MAILGNAGVFALIYLLAMLPTYIMPYLGSNSAALNAAAAVADTGFNLQFLLHVGALLILVAITLIRGKFIDKQWIVIFPILAAFFDLAPVINLIPLVPTVMHVLAIVLGVKGQSTVAQSA